MGSACPEHFDFIVVGAGAAGCLLASRLARSKKQPNVLLLEAGGKNESQLLRIDAERWLTRMNPAMSWGYQTIPQKSLDGLVVPYDRGRGLGGSTSVNFSAWTVGAKSDYDEIARIVGDESWNWSNVQSRYKRIEAYKGSASDVPEKYRKYFSPSLGDHGVEGPIKIGVPTVWEDCLIDQLEAFNKSGLPLNLDHNSGDPIGLSVVANTAYRGVRSTAADALADAPSNLHIVTDSEVARVIFDGTRAIGVETVNGTFFSASREVVLSCGSLDNPRVLMHSGIGPEDQLTRYKIPILHANRYVGQNMMDHHHNTFTWERSGHANQRQAYYKSEQLQTAARAQWEKDQTGPLAEYGCALGIAFLRSDAVLSSPEFEALETEVQTYLKQPTTPTYEFICNAANVDNFIDPQHAPPMCSMFAFVQNRQSRGSVSLQSSDPRQPLLFDPSFLSHPYDRRVVIEMTRELLKLTALPGFAKNTVKAIQAPASDSEDDILAWWKKSTGSTWHSKHPSHSNAIYRPRCSSLWERADLELSCPRPTLQAFQISHRSVSTY